MSTEISDTPAPDLQAEMLSRLGERFTNKVVQEFKRFAFIPDSVLEFLQRDALSENWGNENFVLDYYIAVNARWSIEQGRFTTAGDQIYVSAGHLQTRYGTPLYLVLEPNNRPAAQPFALVRGGANIAAPDLPVPPEIPTPPSVNKAAEIVLMHDHILRDNQDRVPFLSQTPPVAQMCAVAGAVQWSLNRGLELGYWYFGRMQYLVPLYLQSREDITVAPDLVATVEATRTNLLVRTVLEPHMPYAKARVAVERHDRLPPWLLAAWNDHSASLTGADIEGVAESG
jgi:hypothetical protein